MPEKAALVMERPMCLDCIARKGSFSLNEVEAAFLHIGRVLHLQRFGSERCRACGNIGLAFSLTETLPGGDGPLPHRAAPINEKDLFAGPGLIQVRRPLGAKMT